MRLTLALACLLLLMGCVGPHSTGALWAQQNLEQELVIGRQPEVERLAKLRAYELALADESLAAERARLSTALQACPGSLQTIQLSPGDRIRDSIRVRIGGDGERQATVAQLALADWWLRRAQATGEAQFCDEARQALATPAAAAGIAAISVTGSLNGQPSTDDPLGALGSSTTTRVRPETVGAVIPGASSATPAESASTTLLMLSEYALGYTDTVRAPTPLPQYLAAVYGGVVVAVDAPPRLSAGLTPETVVDLLAPVYPQWEPDAIYAALRAT